MEALRVVADVDAAHGKASVSREANNGEHVDDGDIAQKAFGGVVEDGADRIFSASHDALHAVDGSEVMAAIDAVRASRADQDVLGVVGHADHFMRHDLADGEHKIMTAA